MNKRVWIKYRTTKGTVEKHQVVVTNPEAGQEAKGRCPFHEDQNPSLNVNLEKKVWHCPVCDLGGTIDLYQFQIDKVYSYTDKDGRELYQICRQNEPKEFRQRQSDGKGGFKWTTQGVCKVLFNLPAILCQPNAIIFIVEGEKDADTLMAQGYLATTNCNGAGHWLSDYNETLRGRQIVLIPDNDPIGIQHMQKVGSQLHSIASSIKWLKLPAMKDKEDITDWFNQGGTPEAFDHLVKTAPDFDPTLWPVKKDEIDLENAVPPERQKNNETPLSKTKIPADRLADYFLADKFTCNGILSLKFHSNVFLRFNGQCYQVVDQNTLLSMIDTYLRKELPQRRGVRVNISNSLRREILDTLRYRAEILVDMECKLPSWQGPDVPAEGELLVLKNGILALDKLLSGNFSDIHDILFPHDPRFFSTSCLPFDFELEATCPTWRTFLDQTFPNDPDSIACLQEWFGYNLSNENNLKRFMLFTGPTDSGKSVTTNVLTYLIGEDNTSHIPLGDFQNDFKLVSIYGKKANICTEIHNTSSRAEQMLKAITGGDRIQLNRKFKDSVSFLPAIKITFTCNDTPHWDEKNDALFRRMLTILFGNSIPPEKQNKNLTTELTSELSGIFNWAIEGYQRLKSHKAFTISAKSSKELEQQRLRSNTARLYIAENLVVSEENKITEDQVYNCYKQWAQDSGHRALFTKFKFGEEILRYFKTCRRRRLSPCEGHREWFFEGISFGNDLSDANNNISLSKPASEEDPFFQSFFSEE